MAKEKKVQTVGIYKLTIGPHFYYGQSREMETRWHHHTQDLKDGIHDNRGMQEAYDKYGTLMHEVVAVCTVDELNTLEQQYISAFINDDLCLNVEDFVRTEEETLEQRAQRQETARNNRLIKRVHQIVHPDGTVETMPSFVSIARRFRISRIMAFLHQKRLADIVPGYEFRIVNAETGEVL